MTIIYQLPDQSLSCKIIRLSADAANPLSRSRNSWADGDGWVGLHLMQVSRGGGLKGVTGFPVSARSPKTLAPLTRVPVVGMSRQVKTLLRFLDH